MPTDGTDVKVMVATGIPEVINVWLGWGAGGARGSLWRGSQKMKCECEWLSYAGEDNKWGSRYCHCQSKDMADGVMLVTYFLLRTR